MTKRMVNVAVLVAVLTVAVMAPSTTFAAGHGTRMGTVETRGHVNFFEMMLRLIGFNPVSGATKSTPTQTISPSSGSVSTPTYSTDTATWGGGGGRCPLGC